MDMESSLQGDNEDPNGGAAEATLACNCCRRRKLRCSREVPTCQHCRKTASECVYESKRAKPGMKVGAIDNLHRRLDALEKLVHQNSAKNSEPTKAQAYTSQRDFDHNAYRLFSFFTAEFQKFIEDREQAPRSPPIQITRSENPGAKRRRLNLNSNSPNHTSLPSQFTAAYSNQGLELLLDAYFTNLHPWIPMLHEARFRQRVSDNEEQEDMQIIIHAMILAATKYIEDTEAAKSLIHDQSQTGPLRDKIVATAMRRLTVENSQALLIVAFNDIGCGLAAQAWPIVGALTRNVEYLQLATENDEADHMRLLQPFTSLQASKNWTEAEERRRVFWNVFNLDRLCSVMMGWNTSLTSDDVSRRLPCDGIRWRKEDAVTTPYLGIWDKSAGRIGNPLLLPPSNYAAGATQPMDQAAQTPSDTNTSPGGPHDPTNMSTVGAFAYSIEATESLSRVNTYFLQQKVNMHDPKDLSNWLTRFKELDLRLIHWKMLLPQKWKVDMTRQHSRMDPNLTLAHITHNASMLLLHQPIAFPLPDWPFKNRLPSFSSADTCHAAAIEISIIAENYLKNAPASVPVSSQFAFCLYVASKALLLHSQHSKKAGLAPQFWSLVESLKVMAQRWVGPNAAEETNSGATSLAQKYAQKLTNMYAGLTKDPCFHLSVLGYTTEIDQSVSPPKSMKAGVVTSQVRPPGEVKSYPSTGPQLYDFSFPSESVESLRDSNTHGLPIGSVDERTHQRRPSYKSGFSATDLAAESIDMPVYQTLALGENQTMEETSPHTEGNIDLGSVSQLLLDQQYVDMDRIISYDDGIFGAEY